MIVKATTKKAVKEIALHFCRDKTAQELADELGFSRQRIYQISHQLRKLGVDIPKGRGDTILAAVDELKKEEPELFLEVEE